MQVHKCRACNYDLYITAANPLPMWCPSCGVNLRALHGHDANEEQWNDQPGEYDEPNAFADALAAEDEALAGVGQQHETVEHRTTPQGHPQAFATPLETARYFQQPDSAPVEPPKPAGPGQLLYFKAYGTKGNTTGVYRIYLSGPDLLFIRYAKSEQNQTAVAMTSNFGLIGGMVGGMIQAHHSEKLDHMRRLLDVADEALIREICEKEVEGAFMTSSKEYEGVEVGPPGFWSKVFGGPNKFIAVMTLQHAYRGTMTFQIPSHHEAMIIKANFPALFGNRAKLEISWKNM